MKQKKYLKNGNWVQMDKGLVSALPRSRKYAPVEAVLSYQVDVNNNTVKSYRAYARIWGWSLSKVINFIKNKKVTISEHSKNTRETVKFRIFGELEHSERHLKDKSETKAEQVQDTTIRKDNKRNKKPEASPGSSKIRKEIADKVDILKEKVSEDRFDPTAFLRFCAKSSMPEELINMVLGELIEYSDDIDNFWGYAKKILNREEGNYHYAKKLEQHYALKEYEKKTAKDTLEKFGIVRGDI